MEKNMNMQYMWISHIGPALYKQQKTNPWFKFSEKSWIYNELKAKFKLLKIQGKGEILLGMTTPESVINTLWYNICFYYETRGCIENGNMKWGSDGREYVEKVVERQTKTRQGDNIRNIRQQILRMYAVTGSNRCPVAVYKFYTYMPLAGTLLKDLPFYLAINTTW